MFAWLFINDQMPNASQVEITVDGSSIRSQGGATLDANGDGAPGGVLKFNFSTVSVTPVPDTVLRGRIVDPGPDLHPMTADDFDPGPDGQPMTADDVFLLPIAEGKVFIVGLEEDAVFTDADGRFVLESVPAGDVNSGCPGMVVISLESRMWCAVQCCSARRRRNSSFDRGAEVLLALSWPMEWNQSDYIRGRFVITYSGS